ncbi:hypothetical protein GQ42DRAFT_130885 [Ramicandelaber brevisporus]|nr:hypothetical protein GQ42DRAFT_130885 [Ramicandelaber brevisporus]
MLPPCSGADDEQMVALCSAILSSRISSTMAIDEEQTAGQIKKQLLQAYGSESGSGSSSGGGGGTKAALEFGQLHARLKANPAVNNRWSILHLLSQTAGNGSHSRLSSRPLSSLHHNPPPPSQQQQQQQQQQQRPQQSVQVQPGERSFLSSLNASYIPEHLLVRDVLFTMQGVDGQYLKYMHSTGSYMLTPEARVSRPSRTLLRQLTELGALLRNVQAFVDDHIRSHGTGLILQALCSAIQEEVADHFKLIAVLEAQHASTCSLSNNDSTMTAVPSEGLTLRRLLVWSHEPLQKLRLLVDIIEECRKSGAAASSVGGGQLLSIIHSYMDNGDPFVLKYSEQLLNKSAEPFYNILNKWVWFGELDDPHKEFFILFDANVPDEALWRFRFKIDADKIPKFVSSTLAKKIFVVGKSLNLLRYTCNDSQWVAEHGKSFLLNTNSNTANKSNVDAAAGGITAQAYVIEAAYVATSTRLREILFTRYRLMDHLRAIKRYLFLEQGDFAQQLYSLLLPQLGKPAEKLYRHSLTTALESAIRASNAQYDDASITRCLEVRLSATRPEVQTGWDSFSLAYDVSSPLNAIISQKTMQQYMNVFNFLFRLRHADATLERSWQQLITSARDKTNVNYAAISDGDKNMCFRVCHEMLHCIKQVQHFTTFEIIEGAWKQMLTELEKEDKDLDMLILAHSNYLNVITRTLTSRSQRYWHFLVQIIDTVLKFCSAVDKLHDMIRTHASLASSSPQSHYVRMRKQSTHENSGSTIHGSSNSNENRTIEDVCKDIAGISRVFGEQLAQMLSYLSTHQDSNMQFHAVAINFNDVYSIGRRTAGHHRQGYETVPPPLPQMNLMGHRRTN